LSHSKHKTTNLKPLTHRDILAKFVAMVEKICNISNNIKNNNDLVESIIDSVFAFGNYFITFVKNISV
jgi:hypothetical protein